MGIQIPWGPMRALHSLGTVCLEGGSQLCVGREITSVYESLRASSGCLDCSFCSSSDGPLLELGRRGGSRTIVGAGCARVVRTLTRWDKLVGSCRVKSGQVGQCRVKSGEKIFLALFCRYGFALVFSFPEPTPGIGSLSTTLLQTPDSRRSAGGWGQSVVSGRFMSGQNGLCRVRSGSYTFFGLMRLTARTLARRLCWVMGR